MLSRRPTVILSWCLGRELPFTSKKSLFKRRSYFRNTLLKAGATDQCNNQQRQRNGSSLSYYYSRPHKTTLFGRTIGQKLDEAAKRYPEKESFVFSYQGIRKTFSELQHDVIKVAEGFISIGVAPRDRIGLLGPNSYEWLVSFLALAYMGAIAVNINPAFQAPELEYCIKKVGMKGIVSARTFKTQDYYEILQRICPELRYARPGGLKSKSLPSLQHIVFMGSDELKGAYNFTEVLQNGSENDQKQLQIFKDSVQFDDPVNIQFTSGTTGSPKGCLLSHFMLLNNGNVFSTTTGLQEPGNHTLGFPVPLFHAFCLLSSVMSALTCNVRCVFPTPSFEPESTLRAVGEEGITALYATPTMFIDMLNHPNVDKYCYGTLHTSVMAGATCPPEVILQLRERFGIENTMVGYGMTELSFISATNKKMSIQLQSKSVGVMLEHTEAKVVDPDSGMIVPNGVPGELHVRGYNSMLGYWDDEENTRDTIDSARWLHTGDIVTLDEHGIIFIRGRNKEVINRGGENVFPAEIEKFLHTHPKIAEVQVVGIPDDRMGEAVCAAIKLKTGTTVTEDEIISFCKGKIAHFKIPRNIAFVKEFPLTASGKVKKYELASEMSVRFKNREINTSFREDRCSS